ncbi:lysoplasmalogenase [Tenuibacillus multivorans]|uniref:Uncharacterized membrane protein YhhN n=1 Tax=Tenuibacillus multivorans TaxID=237069 RepID=A0A1H0B748_9BACI|nr:lysoplasmalogenase [Tenuibacillus multivorans]GEL78616.1 hypothetical protein TMU01_28510 [Tenuibacillus multivorans]SDN41464.1 Uncharacterized membrane protein YhhN [Tenuibacillus multivorans]
MKNLLTIAIILTALFYIFFRPSTSFEFELFLKVLPIAFIILYAILNMPKSRHLIHYLIIIGLVFGAVGDVTLHHFTIGLTAFLIGHLCYVVAFMTQWCSSFMRATSIVPIILFSYIIGHGLITSIVNSGKQSLIMPIILYIMVISFMVWTAIMTRNLFAAIGAILFLISDAILAWNMFVVEIPYASVLVMLFYYGAQYLIAKSLKDF